MSSVHVNHDPVAVVDNAWVERLKAAAQAAPLRRARLNLHNCPDAPLHEMIIAFCQDSVIAPHRHHGKTESFHVIEGRLSVVLFDDVGNMDRVIQLGPPGCGLPFYYHLSQPLWHTVIPTTSFVVIHETTNGPFIPKESQNAPWLPQDQDGVRDYISELVASVGR